MSSPSERLAFSRDETSVDPSARSSITPTQSLDSIVRGRALSDAHRAVPASPSIHVLENVTVDRLIVAQAEAASGKRLQEPPAGCSCFKALEVLVRPETGNVLENRGARTAVRVGDRLVHAPSYIALSRISYRTCRQ